VPEHFFAAAAPFQPGQIRTLLPPLSLPPLPLTAVFLSLHLSHREHDIDHGAEWSSLADECISSIISMSRLPQAQ